MSGDPGEPIPEVEALKDKATPLVTEERETEEAPQVEDAPDEPLEEEAAPA